jgi:TetR/AcrR family transcriptional repressor of bet genes
VSPKVGVSPVRREQIVAATLRCLARDGYTRLTMKRLAREAGVSQGILHYYFPDKRAILTAAFSAVAADLDRRVAVAQSRSGRDPRSRLRAIVAACLAAARERREVWMVFVEFWGEMAHDARLRALNADLYARARAHLAALVRAGIRTGAFRRVNPDHAAAAVLGLIDGVSLQLTFDDVHDAGTAARFCEDALLRYLGR